MALYLSENEAIQIYNEGLEKAKSKSLEMIKAELNKQPTIFIEFIDSLKRAAGACHGLAHSRIDHSTKWLTLRDNLEKIIDLGQTLPSFRQDNNGVWFQISKVLEQLVTHGKTLYNRKAFSRAEILSDLDVRRSLANFKSDPTALQ